MDEGIRARLGLPPTDRRKGRPTAPYELGLSLLCALLAGLRAQALQPVYGPWMKAARLLGKVNTYLVMSLVYYLLITPYAVLTRWLAGDLLDERLRDRDSYWHQRQAPPEPESYRHQF